MKKEQKKRPRLAVVAVPQVFVITAIFMTQRTVTAKSESHALELAEAELVREGAAVQDLVNWYAHEV